MAIRLIHQPFLTGASSNSHRHSPGRQRLGNFHGVVLGCGGELLDHTLVSGSSWQEMIGEETNSQVPRRHKQGTKLCLTALKSTLHSLFCISGFSFVCLRVCASGYETVDAKDI